MRTELWLKQHGGAERRLADAITGFLDDQLARLMAALDGTPGIVAQVLRVDDEHATFMAIVAPHLIASMGMGAATQLELAGSKAFVPEALENFKLPREVVDAIHASFTELERQAYWRDIQATTSTRVTSVVDETIDAGLGPRAAAKLIRERLGETVFSAERANAIARTETTGAMNSGHQAGYEQLEADGLLAGKTWDSIPDKDRRVSHELVHGATVPVKANFQIPYPTPGGRRRRRRKDATGAFELAPWPGHWGLSPGNRVNCRCTTLGSFDDATLAAEGIDPSLVASACGIHGKDLR